MHPIKHDPSDPIMKIAFFNTSKEFEKWQEQSPNMFVYDVKIQTFYCEETEFYGYKPSEKRIVPVNKIMVIYNGEGNFSGIEH